MIKIDGSYLEGGGQILRTAISLSAITKKACYIFNIRKNRPKPGLMNQHLLGLRALNRLCDGKIEGDSLGSEEIKFYPGEISAKSLNIKIETAGSITLILQTLVPPALFAPGPVEIFFDGGATDTFFSPTIDYFKYVFLKILEKMGAKVDINILKRGYFPEGGAKVKVKVFPIKKERVFNSNKSSPFLSPFKLLERGEFKKIIVISGASELLKNKKVAERQLTKVREILGKLNLSREERVEYYNTLSPGSQICLIAEFKNTTIGADNLGKLGKKAEEVGEEAVLKLLNEQKSNASLDRHLADQILLYLALTKNQSQVKVSEITPHCKTNIWVIEKFLDGKFEIKENLILWHPSIQADAKNNILI